MNGIEDRVDRCRSVQREDVREEKVTFVAIFATVTKTE